MRRGPCTTWGTCSTLAASFVAALGSKIRASCLLKSRKLWAWPQCTTSESHGGGLQSLRWSSKCFSWRAILIDCFLTTLQTLFAKTIIVFNYYGVFTCTRSSTRVLLLLSYRENLKVVRELSDRMAEGRSCGNLGNTHYLLGNFHEAINYHSQVLVVEVVLSFEVITAKVLCGNSNLWTTNDPEDVGSKKRDRDEQNDLNNYSAPSRKYRGIGTRILSVFPKGIKSWIKEVSWLS